MLVSEFIGLIPPSSVLSEIILFKDHLPKKLETFRDNVIKFVESIPRDKVPDVSTYLKSGEVLIAGRNLNTKKVIEYLMPMTNSDAKDILDNFSYYSHQFTSYASKSRSNKIPSQQADISTVPEIQPAENPPLLPAVQPAEIQAQSAFQPVDHHVKDDVCLQDQKDKKSGEIRQPGSEKAYHGSTGEKIQPVNALNPLEQPRDPSVKDGKAETPKVMINQPVKQLPKPSKAQYATEDEEEIIDKKKENTKLSSWLISVGILGGLALVFLAIYLSSQKYNQKQYHRQTQSAQPEQPKPQVIQSVPLQVTQQMQGEKKLRDIGEYSRQIMEKIHSQPKTYKEYDEFGNPVLTAAEMAREMI
jgi:hypothetical protein